MGGGSGEWGPTVLPGGEMAFRLWAPGIEDIRLELEGRDIAMHRSASGWHEALVEHWRFGERYMFRLPDGRKVPDPASRHQPEGVDGASVLIDPDRYRWKTAGWRSRPWHEAAIYEMHIGAFTPEGTYAAAARRLAWIASLGFTAIEIMPLAEYAGARGWGYDGVYHYAPCSRYGTPDELKALVDEAHAQGLMVLLDMVYNHFGHEGNFLPLYAPGFFRADAPTPWGAAVDFSESAVRAYFLGNIRYWLNDFRVDGFRLDAVDQIADPSARHILEEIADLVAAERRDRFCHLVTEDAGNGAALKALDAAKFDADWNDDFHHALHVAVTGEGSGHYRHFAADPWRATAGALAQGYLRPAGVERYDPAGTASGVLSPTRYVHFLQNHDQVGNRALGDRLYRTLAPALFRCLTDMLLLSPQIPLVFMGDDHLSGRPFFFFADMPGERDAAIAGRLKEAENFGGLPAGVTAKDIADPLDPETFRRSTLDWNELDAAAAWSGHLRELLTLRRRHVVPLLQAHRQCVGRSRAAREGHLWVEWSFGENVLSLECNLTATPRPAGEIAGRLLYPADATDGEEIAPWTAHFRLRREAAAGTKPA